MANRITDPDATRLGLAAAILLAAGLADPAPIRARQILHPGGAGRPPHAPPTGRVDVGKTQYEARCGGCHSLDARRVGPRHRGIVGRKAAAVTDYDYSPALRKSRLVWTEANLDRWLKSPAQMVPSTKMGFSVSDAQARADIVAYLKSER